MKKCNTCGERKPMDAFHVARKERDGRAYKCKECYRAYCAERWRTWSAKEPLFGVTEKRCTDCGETKLVEEFNAHRFSPTGTVAFCRPCQRIRDISVRHHLTREQYQELLDASGGVCAICGDPGLEGKGLGVDHDHACCPEPGRSCGRCARGMLCGRCNSALGQMRDNPDLLLSAAAYLLRSKDVLGEVMS